MVMRLHKPSIEDLIDSSLDEANFLKKRVAALIEQAHHLEEEVRSLDPKERRERDLNSKILRLIHHINRIGV